MTGDCVDLPHPIRLVGCSIGVSRPNGEYPSDAPKNLFFMLVNFYENAIEFFERVLHRHITHHSPSLLYSDEDNAEAIENSPRKASVSLAQSNFGSGTRTSLTLLWYFDI